MLSSLVSSTLLRCALSGSERIVVALSGGADSVALLLVLKELGYGVEAAHCNFALRGKASDEDEQFVQKLCEKEGILLHRRQFDTASYAKEKGISIEMAARELRYAWWETLGGIVATGHHLEDNAETLLLNLCRGTGIAGLRGIRYRHGNIVRPLLDCSRQEIEAYLTAKKQAYCTDATNADTAFRRNWVRHELLPLLHTLYPDINRTLHQTALRLQETEAIYRIGLNACFDSLSETLPDGFRLDLCRLKDLPTARTLLHEWLSPLGFHDTAQWLAAKEGSLVEGKGYLATRHATWLEVRKTPAPSLSLDSLCFQSLERVALKDIPKEKKEAYLDAAKIVGKLSLRLPQAGDRFVPLGMKGTKLVSDFLTDRHYSRIDKLGVRLLCDEEKILWIVGERIDQRAALTAATQHVLHITLPLISSSL